jgi:hypothetical protein
MELLNYSAEPLHQLYNWLPRGLKAEKVIFFPEMIADNSIKTDAPFCYRNLDDCLALMEDLIQVEERFEPIAYLGQI